MSLTIIHVLLSSIVASMVVSLLPRRVARLLTLATLLVLALITLFVKEGSATIAGFEVARVEPLLKNVFALIALAYFITMLSLRDALDEYTGPLAILAFAASLLMTFSSSIATFIVGLEACVIASAFLAIRGGEASAEAATKFILASVLATLTLLLGYALRESASGIYMVVYTGLLLIGFCIELGLTPFHLWLPDFVEGAYELGLVTLILLLDTPLKLVLLRFLPHGEISISWLLAVTALASFVASTLVLVNSMPRALGYIMIFDSAAYMLLASSYAAGAVIDPVYFAHVVLASGIALSTTVVASRVEPDKPSLVKALGFVCLASIPPFYTFIAKVLVFMSLVGFGLWVYAVTFVFFATLVAYRLLGEAVKLWSRRLLPLEAPLLVLLALMLILGLKPDLVLLAGGGP